MGDVALENVCGTGVKTTVRPDTSQVKNASIHSEIFGSDHCPVELVLEP